MKTLRLIQWIINLTGCLTGATSFAGYPLYPPTPFNDTLVFEDSDNAKAAATCQGLNTPCLLVYLLPGSLELAKTPSDFPMLSQAIFLSSTSIFNHRVVYNLTLKPMFAAGRDFDAIRAKVGRLYGLSPENVHVTYMPISDVQFVVTTRYGSYDTYNPVPSTTPVPTQPADPAKKAHEIGHTTYFTEYITPAWTGDFISFFNPFTITISGPVWDLEPALQKFFMHPGRNGAAGNVSFRFRAKATPIRAIVSCNLKKFQELVGNTTKEWRIIRSSGPGWSHEEFSNNEWNAIHKRLDVRELCDLESFEDTTVSKSEIMTKAAEQLMQKMLDRAFVAVDSAGAPAPIQGQDPKYTHYESRAIGEADIQTRFSLNEEMVFWTSSDLGFTAGGVTDANLDVNHIYLCDKFERFNRQTRKCEMVCDPMEQVYLRGDSRADANGCVNLYETERK